MCIHHPLQRFRGRTPCGIGGVGEPITSQVDQTAHSFTMGRAQLLCFKAVCLSALRIRHVGEGGGGLGSCSCRPGCRPGGGWTNRVTAAYLQVLSQTCNSCRIIPKSAGCSCCFVPCAMIHMLVPPPPLVGWIPRRSPAV